MAGRQEAGNQTTNPPGPNKQPGGEDYEVDLRWRKGPGDDHGDQLLSDRADPRSRLDNEEERSSGGKDKEVYGDDDLSV